MIFSIFSLRSFLLASLFAFCVASQNSSFACNNSPALCSRPYSSITHLGTHNSAFVRDASTSYSDSGNQNVDSIKQLDAGVRLLSSQVHLNNGEWHLCHSSCNLLDAGKLSTWLASIKAWMDRNPEDVVTILLVNADNASAENLHAEFQAANIISYAYVPTSTTSAIATWPTLQDLISQSKRLIVFVASLDSSTNKVAPYLLDEFVFLFENPFEVTSLSNFSCLPDRPTAVKGNTNSAVQSRRLPLMNHFLYSTQAFGIQVPDHDNITTTNAQVGAVGNLGRASNECKTLYGRAPTFILVDFFEQGSAISTVDSLNGITAVGRTPVAEIKMTTTSSSPGRTEGLRKQLTRWPGCIWFLFVIGTLFSPR